ncbi:hypothetical protein HYR54_17950 [Candidatus Acetothermia bacterium]|nr:hypothetical protein [Candidatus Acetothermia bacterium]MBI3459329.1 hypothetical protein [Candidatus Acetothermia bacterium]MBI3661050.1 hypothetical protein [Candidatus Acetothermia bacterium]
MAVRRRSIGHDPLGESEIMKEFYRPSTTSTSMGKSEKGAIFPSQNGEPNPADLVKATFYLAPDDIISLEELQLSVRKREGRKANKSELIREAISLLIKSYEK